MNSDVQYLVKMLVCSSLLFGYYRLALYNERFHLWNRFYLLAALVLSVTLPLVHISLFAHEQPTAMVMVLEALPWSALPIKETVWSWADWLTMIIALVSVFLLFRLIIGSVKLITTFYKGPVSKLNNLSMVMTNLPEAPFSFFNWLFWRNDLNPHTYAGKRILQHELTHIREGHSFDKLLTEMLLIVFWINPIFWLIKKELNAIHEFLADRKAIDQADGPAFAAMILLAANTNPPQPLTNPFFSSQIKRRLKMITNSKKPKYSYLRRISGLFSISLVIIALIFSLEKTQAQKVPAPPPPIPDTDRIATVAINQTGKDSVIIYRKSDGSTIKMTPNQARKKGYPITIAAPAEPFAPPIQILPPAPKKAGEAQNMFQANQDDAGAPDPKQQPLVYFDGKHINFEYLNSIDPNIIASINVFKGESAVAKYGEAASIVGVIEITSKPKVVSEGMPSKKTGKTTYESKTIVFKGTNNISDPETVLEIIPSQTTNSQKMENEGAEVGNEPKKIEILFSNKPLYLLVNPRTGTIIIDKSVMDALDKDKIELVNVLKDKHATDKYGTKGKNGIVEIILK